MKIFSPTIINNFTASVGIVQGISGSQFSGSFLGNGSGITGIVTSSFALTSSYQSNPRFITISSSAYTLGTADLKNTLAFASGSGIQILTIPSSSVLMASVNDYIDLYQSGSARIQIASGSNSVILNSANGYMTRTTHSVASLLNTGRDRWVFFGDISIT